MTMRRRQLQSILCALVATMMVTFGVLPIARAATRAVGFQPATTVTTVGSQVVLGVAGSSFDRVTEGGGVDLHFDPTKLRVLNVTVDATTWEFFTQAGTINNATGTVSGILFASFAGRTGNFPIANVTFQVVGAGASTVTLTESPLNPFASGGQLLPVTFQSGTVSTPVTPVPIPGVAVAALGLALGITGTSQLRRTRRAA